MFFGARNVLGSNISADEMAFNTIQEVTSTTVTGSAVTSVQITGLDLDTDGMYIIFVNPVSASTDSWKSIHMTCNADTTATNYYSQHLQGFGAAASAQNSNSGICLRHVAGEEYTGFIYITKTSGNKPMAVINNAAYPDSNMAIVLRGWAWTGTANVTSLTWTSDTANSIGVGSTFKVYKVA